MGSQQVFVCKAVPEDKQATIQAVQQLLHNLPAMGRLTPESRVLIKPNLLAKHTPDRAITTHPHVLHGVVLALQQRGVRNITVADSPGGVHTTGILQQLYKTCGIAAVCEELGVAMYTGTDTVDVPTPERAGRLVPQFTLLKPVAESDFIINLPKFKSHVLTGMSGAVKNQFGLVPGLAKAEFHMRLPERELFGRMLVDLNETVQADVHLVDGLLAMEGDGPAGGTVRRAGLLLAGENPYLVDLAICRYMGMSPARPPFLAAAMEACLCPAVLEESQLVGEDEAKTPLAGFILPRSYEGNLSFASYLPGFLQGWFTKFTAPRPVVRKAACIGCGKCAEICPQHVITIAGGKAKIQPQGCIKCFCCHEMCPVKAIDVKRNRLLKK